MKRNILISLFVIFSFALLMIYGLNHSANFNPSPLVGQMAPHFQAPLPTGEHVDSSQIYGKKIWTVLNFWSSNCYVCRSEAGELEKFYQVISSETPQKIQFISINIQDDKDSISNWQKNYAQTFPVLSDEKGLISVDFGVTGTPETFVINPNGIVRFRIAGEIHQQGLLNFVQWLSEHPNANQTESLKAFSNRENPSNASI